MSHNPPTPKNARKTTMNFSPNDNSAPGAPARASNNPSSASAATTTCAANNNLDDSLALLTGDIPLDFDGFHNDALYMSNLLSAPTSTSAAAATAAAAAAAAGTFAAQGAQNSSGKDNFATASASAAPLPYAKISPSACANHSTKNTSLAKVVAATAGPSSSTDARNNNGAINDIDPTKPARRRSSVVSIDSEDEEDFMSAVPSTNNNTIGTSSPNASASASMMNIHMMAHQPQYQQSYSYSANVQQLQQQPSYQQQTFLNNQVNQFSQVNTNVIGSTSMTTHMPAQSSSMMPTMDISSAQSSSMMPTMATRMDGNITTGNPNSATTNMGYPSMESIQFPSVSQILSTHTSSNTFATYDNAGNAGNAALSSNNNINYGNSSATFNQAFNQHAVSSDIMTQSGAGPRFRAFHEKKWDERLLELRAFRQQHGHSLVPHTYPPNPQLARWVKRQRRQHKLMEEGKQSTMTPERCELLDSLGFVWDSHQAAWSEKIQDLRRYQAQNGHCLVPSSYKANPQLATWVKCQRRQYKLYWEGRPSAMTPQRIAELEGMGFVWELRSAASSSATSKSSSKP